MSRDVYAQVFDLSTFPEVSQGPNTGIYAIANLSRCAAYVGTTWSSFDSRWRYHESVLLRGKHWLEDLQHDWIADGRHVFKFVILQELSWSRPMLVYEQFWLAELRAAGVYCYNRQGLGEGKCWRQSFPLEGYYTFHDVATLLHVSYHTVYRWVVREGSVPGIRVQDRWGIPMQAVEGLLRNHLKLKAIVEYSQDLC